MTMPLKLTQYQQIVSVDFLTDEHLRVVLALILDHLKLDIVREQTPDYTAYELRERSHEV